MIDKLKKYVDNLFVGIKPTKEALDLKEEMTQNLIDKYNDLRSDGKSEEAAYLTAINSFGDITDLLKNLEKEEVEPQVINQKSDTQRTKAAILMSIAIMMYILCVVPVLLFENSIGVVLMFFMIAAATGLIVFNSYTKSKEVVVNNKNEKPKETKKENRILGIIKSIIWLVSVGLYLLISFSTGAWYITWIIFPITGCVEKVLEGIFELVG